MEYDPKLIDAVAKTLVAEWYRDRHGMADTWDNQPDYGKDAARRMAKAALETVENYLDGV